MNPVSPSSRPNPLVRSWQRIPLLLRAILGGVFVFSCLQFGWNILVVANIQVSPGIPWSVPAGLLYLWVVFQFFNGRWGPRATSDARHRSMRARILTLAEWKQVSLACVLVFFFVFSFAMLIHRLILIPEDPALPDLPWWSLYPTLIMVSLVAGVSEEAGFRGYMQGPLEKRYRPWIAIGITSILFWLLHLNHPSGFARFPYLVAAGIAFGSLTYAARSILPALVTHAVIDSVAFVGTTAGIGPESLWSPPPFQTTGADPGFVATLAIAIVSGVALVISLRKLAIGQQAEGQTFLQEHSPSDSVVTADSKS